MNHWLDFSHTKPLVIGHRGASSHAPENTLAACRLALAQGADGIEFDVKRCASGEVVIMHDVSVDRTTNGSGNVHQLSLNQLKELDAGNGERVPLLDELFEALGNRDAVRGRPFLFNVEVTNYSTPRDGLEQAVIEVVRRHNIAARVMFSSFNPLSVRKLAQLAPEIPRGILYSGDMPIHLRNVWLAPFVPHQFRHPHHNMVTADYVQKLAAQGLRVNTWTVNEPNDMRRLTACGVNVLMGDSPKTMQEVIGE
jgi:glycerophosphoryl diester phosphodiesterase